jgi:hypothetical protein
MGDAPPVTTALMVIMVPGVTVVTGAPPDRMLSVVAVAVCADSVCAAPHNAIAMRTTRRRKRGDMAFSGRGYVAWGEPTYKNLQQ